MNNSSKTSFAVLLTLSFCHLSNDTLQSLIPSIYPLIKSSLMLNFSQIGLITLTFQITSSIFQPVVGWYTDKHPMPYSLPIGMSSTMLGVLLLSFANSLPMVLVAVAFTGFGSAIFHPEASRLAHMASGGKHGTAQSVFQVGGNLGSSLGPLLAALLIAPYGQKYIGWFALLALTVVLVMLRVSRWYKLNLHRLKSKKKDVQVEDRLPRKTIVYTLLVLLMLIFSKYVYMASLTNYYTFYLIDKFGVSVPHAQLFLFIFLFSVAAGTMVGGPIGDRIGRKYVIWISILGVAPFTMLMPYVGLVWTGILSAVIGFVLSSAFSAILVYAQEMLPGKVGLISGLFFGLAFGIAGVASAVLGNLADHTGIQYVYKICAYLPLIGLVAGLLPDIRRRKLNS